MCFLVHGCGDKRGPDGTGTDGVDADTFADLLVGKGAGEGYDGTFGGSIAGELLVAGLKKGGVGNLLEKIWATNVWVYGSAGDDCVTAGHLWEDVFGKEEEWMDVNIKSVNPLISIFIISITYIFSE